MLLIRNIVQCLKYKPDNMEGELMISCSNTLVVIYNIIVVVIVSVFLRMLDKIEQFICLD